MTRHRSFRIVDRSATIRTKLCRHCIRSQAMWLNRQIHEIKSDYPITLLAAWLLVHSDGVISVAKTQNKGKPLTQRKRLSRVIAQMLEVSRVFFCTAMTANKLFVYL